MDEDDKELIDICFPVPQNFSLSVPAKIDTKENVKRYIFQQTIRAAYLKKIPYDFTSEYKPKKPYQLVSDEEIENVVSLFQAIGPQDALEMALAQQFIVTHIQAIDSASGNYGMSEKDMKKFELTHKILETLMKYRCKGAQQIQVNYNHNQGQINNIRVMESDKSEEPIEVKNEL
jgi:hypothetical protein